ncbi:MAG: hypothetical protein RR290_04225 [Clostridia bacterium]
MRKINLGIVLSIIVLVVLTGYLATVEISRNDDKKEIFNICKEYIEDNTKYSMLEEQYRTIDKTITDDEFNKYLKLSKEKIDSYLLDDKDMIDIKNKSIEDKLKDQIINKRVITKFTKTDFKEKGYVFDGDIVVVTIESYAKIEEKVKGTKYIDELGAQKVNINDDKKENPLIDIITLKKVDNKYKIMYDVLTKPMEMDMDMVTKW